MSYSESVPTVLGKYVMSPRSKISVLGSYEFSVVWPPRSPYLTHVSFILVWERIPDTVEGSICEWRLRNYKNGGQVVEYM